MDALQYASDLIKFDSVSSRSNVEIIDHLDRLLRSFGFDTERIVYHDDGVRKENVIARKGPKGHGDGGLAYFGHTDVVPVDDWSITEHGPFAPTVRDERLYGRGATDMKGSLACMLTAAKGLQDIQLSSPIYLCFSADEELDHRGIKEVTERSAIYQELIEGSACAIVGEPTGMQVVYAHKGGVQIVVTSKGKAAHSSTREGINANLAMIPFLQFAKELHDETEQNSKWWDNEFDPPSICLNIGINDHTAAVNITAPQSVCTLCFRPMPKTDVEAIVHRIEQAADSFGLEFHLKAQNPSFRRDPESEFAKACTKICSGAQPSSVAYGSEAGNLSAIQQLIVLGPGSIQQAHKSDEWISLRQLEVGTDRYRRILEMHCV